MVDIASNSAKLVEFNTIAAGMGILSSKVRKVQKYIRDKYSDIIDYNYPEQIEITSDHNQDDIAALKHAKDMDTHVAKFAEYFKNTIDAYK